MLEHLLLTRTKSPAPDKELGRSFLCRASPTAISMLCWLRGASPAGTEHHSTGLQGRDAPRGCGPGWWRGTGDSSLPGGMQGAGDCCTSPGTAPALIQLSIVNWDFANYWKKVKPWGTGGRGEDGCFCFILSF